MPEQTHPAFDAASECVDTGSLTERLGSAEELTALSHSTYSHQLTKVHSLPALREFLIHYREDILAPFEFHYIHEASQCASRNQLKELLAIDTKLSREDRLKEFQLASRSVGKRQLNRMRPLKDLRFVRRYKDEVNEGKAFGWHMLVYGVVLSTYSIPLRQGLLHYGRQTLGGFIEAAARPLDLTESAVIDLRNELSLSLPPLIQQTLAASSRQTFKVV